MHKRQFQFNEKRLVIESRHKSHSKAVSSAFAVSQAKSLTLCFCRKKSRQSTSSKPFLGCFLDELSDCYSLKGSTCCPKKSKNIFSIFSQRVTQKDFLVTSSSYLGLGPSKRTYPKTILGRRRNEKKCFSKISRRASSRDLLCVPLSYLSKSLCSSTHPKTTLQRRRRTKKCFVDFVTTHVPPGRFLTCFILSHPSSFMRYTSQDYPRRTKKKKRRKKKAFPFTAPFEHSSILGKTQ